MQEYVLPILIFLGFGALGSILLVIASKVFAVKGDKTAEEILEKLPGANCGGCGFSGCEGYANAIARGEAPLNLCKPGGADTMKAIGVIMGQETGEFVAEKAFVRCNGNCDATEDKYTYIGTDSCAALERFYNGKGNCRYRCAGHGDCVKVCDHDAIHVVNGVAVVTAAKCVGCGKCVAACPNHLIILRKEPCTVAVRCSSLDTGKMTRMYCKNGCIACRICENNCPEGAIKVSDNHAIIDYNKCTSCGTCIEKCPRKCIVRVPRCEN